MVERSGEVKIAVREAEGGATTNVTYANISPDMAWEALRAMINCAEEVVRKVLPPMDDRECVLSALEAFRLVMSGCEARIRELKIQKAAKF